MVHRNKKKSISLYGPMLVTYLSKITPMKITLTTTVVAYFISMCSCHVNPSTLRVNFFPSLRVGVCLYLYIYTTHKIHFFFVYRPGPFYLVYVISYTLYIGNHIFISYTSNLNHIIWYGYTYLKLIKLILG